jgi:hypothetical protein
VVSVGVCGCLRRLGMPERKRRKRKHEKKEESFIGTEDQEIKVGL